MSSGLTLSLIAALGTSGLAVVLVLRLADQGRADADRRTVALRFPRGLTADQVEAVVRVLVGLGRARHGLAAQPSVAFELVGTRRGLSHRLRMSRASSTNLIAQLRAAVPGLAVEDVETPATSGF